MLQKDLLLEHKTVLGNIILPLLIQKVDKAEAIARADEILATFQLTAVRDKYPHELSGGMRQRVALLRTYLFGHKLFLLDEAFSALDEMTKMELHAWYLEIHKQLQLTTLIITHRMYLSEGTVRNYLSALLEKLELRDRTQLAVYYYKEL